MRSSGRVLVGCVLLVVTGFAPSVFAATSLEIGLLRSSMRDVGNRVSLGMRFGPVQPQKVDAEFGVTFFAGTDEASAYDGSILGAAGAALDLGIARSFASGREAALVPRLSLTAVSAVGEGGGGVAMGVNGGLSYVTLPARGAGVRIDTGIRWLPLPQDNETLWNISLGLLWP